MDLISSTTRYSCPIFTVTEDVLVEPSGKKVHRSIVRHAESAVIFAVDTEERILLVKQFRLAVNAFIWELPAGKVDDGESPLEAARRELAEETGCSAANWRLLIRYQPTPGYVSEEMNLYLATGVTHGEATPMDDEDIESRWFTSEEIEAAIRKGEMADGKTLVGYWAWKAGI